MNFQHCLYNNAYIYIYEEYGDIYITVCNISLCRCMCVCKKPPALVLINSFEKRMELFGFFSLSQNIHNIFIGY